MNNVLQHFSLLDFTAQYASLVAKIVKQKYPHAYIRLARCLLLSHGWGNSYAEIFKDAAWLEWRC